MNVLTELTTALDTNGDKTIISHSVNLFYDQQLNVQLSFKMECRANCKIMSVNMHIYFFHLNSDLFEYVVFREMFDRIVVRVAGNELCLFFSK